MQSQELLTLNEEHVQLKESNAGLIQAFQNLENEKHSILELHQLQVRNILNQNRLKIIEYYSK